MKKQTKSNEWQEEWVMFLLEHFQYREYTFSSEDLTFQKEYAFDPREIQITGSIPLSLFEQKVGNLSQFDLESFQWDFTDHKKVKEFFTNYLYDITPQQYHTFSYVDIDFKKKESSWHVSVKPYFG